MKETKGNNTLVTFSIGGDETPSTSQILLLGDFNNWKEDSSFLMKKEDGSYVKSLKLENGKRYEFRYLSENNGWFNDSGADDYVASPYYGIENCVVDLTAAPVKKKAVKTTKKSKKDDLKKIEGIGPKISSILIENGIDTFEKLSEATATFIEEKLKEAGSRFSMHKAGSWPKQAKLAFEDKWDELKKLQEKLKGGR